MFVSVERVCFKSGWPINVTMFFYIFFFNPKADCKFADVFSLFQLESPNYLTVLATYDFLVHAVLYIYIKFIHNVYHSFLLQYTSLFTKCQQYCFDCNFVILYRVIVFVSVCLDSIHCTICCTEHNYHQPVWQDITSYLCSSNVHSKVLRNIVSWCSYTLATFYLKANIIFFRI